MLVFGLLVVLALVATTSRPARHLGRIDGAFDGLRDRPRSGARRDDPAGRDPARVAARDVPWLRGEQSVESVMLVEIAADRREVQVETLPPDPG